MRHALTLHPDSRSTAATRIEADVARPRPDLLVLTYSVAGRIAGIRLPPVTAPARTDGLWQHTCFEAFVRAAPGDAYDEFNFAPSTAWAAYRFNGYRAGMAALPLRAPRIDVRAESERFELQVALELEGLPRAPWRLALSAVIEETTGAKSYWALAHPPGKADFHHSDSFVLELPAA